MIINYNTLIIVSSNIPLKCPILLSGWIGPKSVRLFVPVARRCHFLAMLGKEPPEKISLATIGRKERGHDDDWVYNDDSDSDIETRKDENKNNTSSLVGQIIVEKQSRQEDMMGTTEEGVTPKAMSTTGEDMSQDDKMIPVINDDCKMEDTVEPDVIGIVESECKL